MSAQQSPFARLVSQETAHTSVSRTPCCQMPCSGTRRSFAESQPFSEESRGAPGRANGLKGQGVFPPFSRTPPGCWGPASKVACHARKVDRHVESRGQSGLWVAANKGRSCYFSRSRERRLVPPAESQEGRGDGQLHAAEPGAGLTGPGRAFLPGRPSISKSPPPWEAFCSQAVSPKASPSPLWASVFLTENGT